MTKTEKLREQLHEILDMVIDTNGFESRSQDETGDMPTVFMHFMGHVNGLQISINKDGWASYKDYSFNRMYYLEEPLSVGEMNELEYVFIDAKRPDTNAQANSKVVRQEECSTNESNIQV